MLEVLNTLMMIIGYLVSILIILVSTLVFLIENIDINPRAHFAWLPRYVYRWDQDYKKGTFIWLRRYYKTSSSYEYYGLDGGRPPKGIEYVTSYWRKGLLG